MPSLSGAASGAATGSIFGPIGLGAGAFLGGLFGGRKSKQSTRPTRDPNVQGLLDRLIGINMSRLKDTGLPEGFEERGITDINRTFDLGQQSLDNTLSSRGLLRSPIAGAGLGNITGRRVGEISRFQQSLPLIERQFRNEDLDRALRSIFVGQGSETEFESGGGFGQGLNDMSSILAFLYGSGAFGGGGTGAGANANASILG